jgi:hypothetical protein
VVAAPAMNPGGCSIIGERPLEDPLVGDVGRELDRCLKKIYFYSKI